MSGPSSLLAGLIQSLTGLGATGAALLGERLELAGLELREAALRLIQAVILACLAAGLFVLGLGLLCLTVVSVLPAQWRVWAMAGMGGLGLLGGVWALTSLRRRLKPPFGQTMAELKKDRQCF